MIVGTGRFGAETLELARQIARYRKNIKILGFLDDYTESRMVSAYPVLGGVDEAKELSDEEDDVRAVVAIGNTRRKKGVVERYQSAGLSFTNLIHPTAIIPESVRIGEGCIVTAGCIFTVDIEIGNHVILNLGTTVGHDARIGSYWTFNPQVAINGKDRIGEGVYLGTGAKLIHEVSIGEWSLIGAGAVVVSNIPKGVLAVGVPAKPIKERAYI